VSGSRRVRVGSIDTALQDHEGFLISRGQPGWVWLASQLKPDIPWRPGGLHWPAGARRLGSDAPLCIRALGHARVLRFEDIVKRLKNLLGDYVSCLVKVVSPLRQIRLLAVQRSASVPRTHGTSGSGQTED